MNALDTVRVRGYAQSVPSGVAPDMGVGMKLNANASASAGAGVDASVTASAVLVLLLLGVLVWTHAAVR